jgi:1,4-dihydroxy-2-naphthoyl-CoA hydrolase
MTPDQLNAFMKSMLPGHLGMQITQTSPDTVTGVMLVRPELCTAGETLHGGAVMAFADTLGAVATLVNMPAGARTTTIESKTNFISAAPVGTHVTGETTAFHKGRTTQVWQTRITGDSGKLIAVITQTQMILPKA